MTNITSCSREILLPVVEKMDAGTVPLNVQLRGGWMNQFSFFFQREKQTNQQTNKHKLTDNERVACTIDGIWGLPPPFTDVGRKIAKKFNSIIVVVDWSHETNTELSSAVDWSLV